MNDYPIYIAKITDDVDGIKAVSLVSSPAVEVNFLCFNKEEVMKFSVADEEQHIITGPILIADKKILRLDEYGNPYYIVFQEDTIKAMCEKMLSTNMFNNIDIEHDGVMLSKDDVKLQEIYIVNSKNGINPNFVEIPDGSLMATYKIYNDELWDKAKNGDFKGFSVECYIQQVLDNKNKNNKMSKIKELLKSLLTDFTEVETDKGTVIYDGELAVGTEVRTEEGDYVEDGEYVIDEKTIVIADGKVVEVKEKEVEEKEEVKEVEAAEQVEEVVETEEPVEEDNRIEELQTKVSDLEERLKAIEELVKKINEETPVEPIEEQEFSKVVKSKNKAAEMAAYLNK